MNLILNKLPTSNFKPSKIPGLVLWLDSSSLSALSDSTPIDTWSDLSGQGNHATQGTAVNKPTKETVTNNGRTFAVARFDGVDDWLQIITHTGLSFEYSDPFTVCCVAKNISVSNDGFIYAKQHNVVPYKGYYVVRENAFDSVSFFLTHNVTDSAHIRDVNAFSNNFIIITCTNTGTGLASGMFAITNGVDGTSIIQNNFGSGTLINTVNPTIGSRDNGGVPWTGDISHILIYNRALSTSERQRVERWLSKKTGVTLA